jgi:integrase
LIRAIYLAMMMLARCGMRINEPLRLCRHHYRADEGSLYIERTKFRKDRLIPLPKALRLNSTITWQHAMRVVRMIKIPFCWQAETVNRSRCIGSVGSFIAPLKRSA